MDDPTLTRKGTAEDQDTADVVLRVLVWVLLGAILLILVTAVLAVVETLLGVMAGATTLLALLGVVGVGALGAHLWRLEARVRDLERRS